MLQSFKLAIKSIWGNKTRSFLTMLGIIIGVGAVIMLISLVNGYMANVMKDYTDMGVNQIHVNVTNLKTRSVSSAEVYRFYEENSELFENVSPSLTVSKKVRNGTKSMKYTTVQGCSEQYMAIKGYKLQKGRPILYSDVISRQNICVIGAYVAQNLYGSAESAVGQQIKIGENTYDIIGAFEAKYKDYLYSGGEDDFVWMPYTVAIKAAKNANIGDYIFTVRDISRSNEGVTAIEHFLQADLSNKELYSVTTMSGMLDSLKKQMASISNMLGGIAGISLLVAGVGVMNIMLVSVTERTREIGIRKSLGANRRAIMGQFIIEAAVTSTLGGVIGIIIGCIATPFVGKAVGISATPSLAAVLVSFGVSVGIGLFFGFMPANRAASLNPIDALRND